MRSLLGVVLVVSCSCASTLPLSQQRTLNRVLLAVSTLELACDMGQTIPVAMSTPRDQPYEANWLMGTHPSVGTLVGYNAVVATGDAAVYQLLPERRRWLVPLVLGIVEAAVIANNANGLHATAVQRPFCGIR